MLNLSDYIRSTSSVQIEKKLAKIPARAVAFIIDTEVVDVLIMEVDAADLLTTADSFNELPSTPPALYVSVIKNGQEIETLQCDEKMWAILCSEPTIINLTGDAAYNLEGEPLYPSAVAPGWKHVDGEFKEDI
jgi:hypothetical protein